MVYKIDLDILDFRRDKFWIQQSSDKSSEHVDIINELLDHLDQLTNGILNQYNKDFISFTDSFQDLCFQFNGILSKFVKQNHVDIFLKNLSATNPFEINKQILDVLFILTKDNNIKYYLYKVNFLNVLFQLYQIDNSYFIPISNILSTYFINTEDEIRQEIINRKFEEQSNKTTSFFKEIIKFAESIEPENLIFAHSALFLLSSIICNYELKYEQLNIITNALIKRLNSKPQEVDLDDIIYCFCCLIRHYPNNIFLFSQVKIIWCFPYIFEISESSQYENEFIGYLSFLQHILSVDGTHISYFYYSQPMFSRIFKRFETLDNPSENCLTSVLKALYFGVKMIQPLTNLMINDGFLEFLLNVNEQSQFQIKELTLRIINEMLANCDIDSSLILLNSSNIIDNLSLIDQFSSEFFESFLENMVIAFSKTPKDKLKSLDNQIKQSMQNIATSEYDNISIIAQYILNNYLK